MSWMWAHTHACVPNAHACTHRVPRPCCQMRQRRRSFRLSGVSSPPGGSSSVLILLVAGLKACRPTPLDLSTVIILTSSPPPQIPSLLLCNVNQTYSEWINRDTSRHVFISTRGNTDQMMEPGHCWRILTFSNCNISKDIHLLRYTPSLKLRPQEQMCLMFRLTHESWGNHEAAQAPGHQLHSPCRTCHIKTQKSKVQHRIHLRNHLTKHLLPNDLISNTMLFHLITFWWHQVFFFYFGSSNNSSCQI